MILSRIVKENNISSAEISALLKNGGVIIYPTDTIYGIGCDAANRHAIEKIFTLKERDRGKPLLLLADAPSSVERYVQPLTFSQRSYFEKYWPGSITFVLRSNGTLPGELSGGQSTVAFRVPDHQLSRSLVRFCGSPIVSTSANISGAAGGEKIDRIINDFSSKADMIIDAGDLPLSLPSTVVDLTLDPPQIVRQGRVQFSIL